MPTPNRNGRGVDAKKLLAAKRRRPNGKRNTAKEETENLPGYSVAMTPLDNLIPYARNARTHSPEQIAQIAGAIIEWGFTNPILADAKGIVAGHGRVLALRQLYDAGKQPTLPNGRKIPTGCCPVIDCTGWADTKRQAYIIADNQLALNAGWDSEILKIELADLQAADFNLDLIAFSADQMNLIINGWKPDLDLVNRTAEDSDGITAVFRVRCAQDEADEVLAALTAAIADYPNATVAKT